MNTSISTFICNHKKAVLFVIEDGLSLFTHGNLMSLQSLFVDDSKAKLDLLFEKAEAHRSAINWELKTTLPEPNDTIFGSILTWKGNIILRLSKLIIPSFFFDLTIDNEKPASLFLPPQPANENASKQGRFNYLQNELSILQNDLQKKNIQIEALNEKLEAQACIDPLTSLYNRRAITNRLKLELIRAMREKKLACIAIIDIDHLLKINDDYGHDFGDECLKKIANTLNGSIRQYDSVGRIGADEFLVVFSVNSVSQFEAVLERLHSKIAAIELLFNGSTSVTLKTSIGAIWLSSANPEDHIGDFISQAEKNLKTAKYSGGNQITSSEMVRKS